MMGTTAIIIASVLGGIIIGVLCTLGLIMNQVWAELETAQRSFDRIENKLDRILNECHDSPAA